MAEIAPGLYVTPYMEPGAAYVLREPFPDAPGGSGAAGSGCSLMLAASDWERLDPAQRERIIDEFTRRSAEWGADELQRWLTSKLNEGLSGALCRAEGDA